VTKNAAKHSAEKAMGEPRNIDIAYAYGHWRAELGSESDRLDCPSLMQLIKDVQTKCPGEVLTFVVKRSTVQGHDEAEEQFLEASEKSGAFVIWSTECN
jgi:hypothetical protein